MPKQQFMEKYNSGEPYENIAADFDVTDEDFGHRLDTLNLWFVTDLSKIDLQKKAPLTAYRTNIR